MLKKTKRSLWPETMMLLLFLVVLTIKIIISFQNTSLNHESYYHLSQAKTILEQGKPDMQSYIYDNSAVPIVDYALAFNGLFFNLEIVAKILINLLVSSLIIIVYYIVYEFTKHRRISFFASMFTAFIPLLFKSTINNFSSSGISLFFYMLTLLFFIKSMRNSKLIRHFIIFLIILILVTPTSIIFMASFLIYFILLKAEKIKIRLSEIETFLFSLVLGGWLYIIIYKNAIIQKGLLFFLHPTLESTTTPLTITILVI
jgi:asparagine N-glycosylation enzyme membrane subunit Stt3